MTDDGVGFVGLVAGNVEYLIVTLGLAAVYNMKADQMVSGAFAETAPSIVQTCVLIGGMLGIVDVVVVLELIGQLEGGPGVVETR